MMVGPDKRQQARVHGRANLHSFPEDTHTLVGASRRIILPHASLPRLRGADVWNARATQSP